MHAIYKASFFAALALCALPVPVPAGEAPATSAASQRDAEKKLAEAQQRLDAAAREVADLSGRMGRRFEFRLENRGNGAPPRSLLGVNIDSSAGRQGAHVADVSPGGAAAEAGIKAGDIITGIADLDLTKDSDPNRALLEKMPQLPPDQKVKVTVLRDGKKMSFDVAPRPAPPGVMMGGDPANLGNLGNFGNLGNLGNPGGRGGRGRGDGPGRDGPGPEGAGPRGDGRGNVRELIIRGQPGRDGMGGPGDMRNRAMEMFQQLGGNETDTRFGGAELASLSERLGSYFGVKSGVLVVRAGVDSPFKLQDGDVILSIDGRETATAQQAGRVLRSYQPGEKLTLKVQRDRKVLNIDATAPGGRRD